MVRSLQGGALGLVAAVVACGSCARAPSSHTVVAVRPDAATVGVGADADAARAGVSGTVEAPDGAPVAGAVVALNDVDGDAIAVVRTDERGRFEAPRPRAPFAVTATSTRGTAAYLPPAEVTSAPLRLRLGSAAEGLTIAGTVALTSGRLGADALVIATRIGPDDGDLFYAPVAASGRFAVVVPPGRYVVRPAAERLLARPSRTQGAARERVEVAIEASERAPAPEELVRWLRNRAMPIATTAPGPSSDDLAAVGAVLAGARVIGVGEATHGTREYFRLKHRLLQRLVARHDVTLLAMEANFGDADRVDEWIQTGRGTVEEAMASGLFVVWRTEEMRDLLVWLRAWNANPRHPKKVHLRGYDAQGARGSVAALRTYLRKVDPAAEAELLAPLAPLDGRTNSRGVVTLDEAEAEAVRAGVARLDERLAAARATYVARSSASEHTRMRRHARVIEQARGRYAAKSSAEQFVARDRAMAENVVWLSEQLAKDERMMVWAHNGHVQLGIANLPGENMGRRLRARFGRDYLAAGFVLDEGTYRAWATPDAPTIADVAVGPHGPGWVAEAFSRAGAPVFAIDLRGAPAGPVRSWLFAPHVLHSCGWIVDSAEQKGSVSVLGDLFDVAIYVARTTSAHQLPKLPR